MNIKRNKKEYVVEFENKTSLKVLENVKNEFNLYINKDISENDIECIKEENNIQSLFDLCVKRLITDSYSPNKLREFLKKKNATKKEIDLVIRKLQKYSLLNEEEIVENVISYCDTKHYGYNKIISMLKMREISLKKIENIKCNLRREEKEAKLQRDLLIKKYKNKNTKNLRSSVYQALIRYGFDEQISSNLSSQIHNLAINELNMLKLDYLKLFSSYSRKVNEKDLKQKIINKLISKGYSYNDIKKVMEENNHEMG